MNYIQENPSDVWTFHHEEDYPAITAYRVEDEAVFCVTPRRIEYTDAQTINIFFDTTIRGFAQTKG